MSETAGRPDGAAAWMMRAVREPLVQFIAAGAALFALNALVSGPPRPPDDVIVVSEGRIAQIAEGFRLLAGRPPTPDEMNGLVDEFVAEEMAYREAVAMGLDADDTVVRRRLRQKLDFLLEDMDGIAEPTQADLEGWLAAHANRYMAPERRALVQVMASVDQRGDAAADEAVRLLEMARKGADPTRLGDATMLPTATPLTTRAGVATQFGRDFADAVFAAPEGEWFGPVASSFGVHAVRVSDIAPPRDPPLAEVIDRVRADWIAARRADHAQAREAEMRERYQVRIDWPSQMPTAAAPNAEEGAAQ